MNNKIILNIPYNIKIIFWKNKKNEKNLKLNLLSENKKFYINFFNKKIKIDKWTNSIIIYQKIYLNINNNNTKKLTINSYNEFFKLWNIYIFKKIKFKGKGFRIKFLRKTKLIKFYFGKSHKTFFFLKKLKKKRINKYKFILMSLNKIKLNTLANKIVNIKKINKYTLRGLRMSKQIIYKRKGKKGTYI